MPQPTIGLDKLIAEFSSIYLKQLTLWRTQPIPTPTELEGEFMFNPLPVRIIANDNAYTSEIVVGMNGAGVRILRRYQMLMKALDNHYTQILPINRDKGKPSHTTVHPSRYQKMIPVYGFSEDPITLREIAAFRDAILEISRIYGTFRVSFKRSPNMKKIGVIGVDIPFTEPSWVKEISKGKPEFNPAVTAEGKYYFGEENLEMGRVVKAVRKLNKQSGTRWKSFVTSIYYDKFMKSSLPYTVTVIGIANHARICLHTKTKGIGKAFIHKLTIIDPWQTAAAVKAEPEIADFVNLFKDNYKDLEIDIAELPVPDQATGEGSCVLASFARAIWIADKGPEVALQHPIPYEYAVLSLRLLRNRHLPRESVVPEKLEDDIEEAEDEGTLIPSTDPEDVPVPVPKVKRDKKKKAQNPKGRMVPNNLDVMNPYEDDHRNNRFDSIQSDEIYRRFNVGHRHLTPKLNKNETGDLDCLNYASTELLPHQVRVINFIMNSKQRGILLFHSLGSGKTITSIAAARCFLSEMPKAKLLFVTPSSVAKQFEKEVQRLGKDAPELMTKNVKVVTHNIFAKTYKDIVDSKTILVIDEVHNFRTLTGSRAKAAIEACKIAYKVVLMSATPIVNNPTDMISILLMLYGFGMDGQDYIKKIFKTLPDTKEIENLVRCRLSHYAVPMDIKNFPRVTEKFKTFRMDDKYYNTYAMIQDQTLNEQYMKVLDSDKDPIKSEKQSHAFYSLVRKAANQLIQLTEEDVSISHPSQKVLWTVERATKLVKKGKKVAIFTAFKSNGVQLLTQLLEKAGAPKPVIVEGSKTPSQRLQAIKEYNTGKASILIFTMAGAEGMDLKGTHTMIVMDPWWNANKTNQITGRVARYQSHIALPVRDRHVNIHYLVLKKPHTRTSKDVLRVSIDEILYRLSEDKEKNNVLMNDVLRTNSTETCSAKERLQMFIDN